MFVVWFPLICNRAMTTDEKLRRFAVGSVPTVIYIPEFINEAEETQLSNHVVVLSIRNFLYNALFTSSTHLKFVIPFPFS